MTLAGSAGHHEDHKRRKIFMAEARKDHLKILWFVLNCIRCILFFPDTRKELVFNVHEFNNQSYVTSYEPLNSESTKDVIKKNESYKRVWKTHELLFMADCVKAIVFRQVFGTCKFYCVWRLTESSVHCSTVPVT